MGPDGDAAPIVGGAPASASPRVRFKTLGCKVNQVESETAGRELLGRGCRIVDEGPAEVVIVNTCTVTAEADSKARKEIRRALASAGEPVVVVTGCLAALAAQELRAMSSRVVVQADRDGLAADVARMLQARPEQGASAVGDAPALAPAAWRTRAMVKVQDGCDQRCAYCIVPDARGAPRSRSLQDVLADVAALASAGTREIVLTGVNIGGWQQDEAGLAELVEAVCDATPGRVRISSIEPTHVTPRFLEVAARLCAGGVLCPHFHIPLQSGSDEVLGAMRRPYDTAAFGQTIGDLRAAVHGVAITTDVIGGFPGETPEQARDTARFCSEVGFQRLHVFRYSERPGTPAATMPGSVAIGERSSRAADLRALSERLLAGYTSGRIGQCASALVEEKGTATTEDYLRVEVAGGPYPVGSLMEVRLRGPNPEGMLTAEPCGGAANVSSSEGVRA